MAKLSSLKAAFRRKKGFSLIAVMIISLINLAIMGVALQFAVSSSGGGRVNSAMAMKYNLLQSALEDGKALLKKSMDNDGPPHSYLHNGIDTSSITRPDMLLLTDSPSPADYPGVDFPLGHAITKPMVKSDLKRIGIFGDSGELTVKIYDMQYKPESVAENVEDLQSMPPSMPLPTNYEDYKEVSGLEGRSGPKPQFRPNDRGVYLIRAALTVRDAAGTPIHTWSRETAVIQYNNIQYDNK